MQLDIEVCKKQQLLLEELNKIIINKKDELINYFFVRYVVWYLLFSGRNASSKRFMEESKKLFDWLSFAGYKNKIVFFSNKIKSEPFKNRIVISIILFLNINFYI